MHWLPVLWMGMMTLFGPRDIHASSYETDHRLHGSSLLEGIKEIIGADPRVPRNELEYKPFVGSFSTIHSAEDPNLSTTSYCLTDNACGHFEAYSRFDVPLFLLDCNHFCFIDDQTRRYHYSDLYTTDNPPDSYLNCGWETCG